VGHAGIYNSEKAITDSYDANNWQSIMQWMKENSRYRQSPVPETPDPEIQ